MDAIRHWIEKSPYPSSLGVELAASDGASVRLRLSFKEENSNPGRALHGGCAASLAALGGLAVARTALGEDSGPWHTCSLQMNYLAAAIGEEVVADARLLRRGKQICFVEVDVGTAAGKAIAHATAAVRGRFGAAAASRVAARRDDGASDPGPMGPFIEKMPFVGRRGIRVEHMVGARSRLAMPYREANADAGGGVHEGALLALLDTTGAMACWAETGPGPHKASTPSMQAQILAPPGREDLVAYGRVVQRDREIFWSEVEIACAPDARLCARGTVIYRIVT